MPPKKYMIIALVVVLILVVGGALYLKYATKSSPSVIKGGDGTYAESHCTISNSGLAVGFTAENGSVLGIMINRVAETFQITGPNYNKTFQWDEIETLKYEAIDSNNGILNIHLPESKPYVEGIPSEMIPIVTNDCWQKIRSMVTPLIGFKKDSQGITTTETSYTPGAAGIQGKRVGPKDVAPVVVGHTRIEALQWGRGRGLGQNGGYIVAYPTNVGPIGSSQPTNAELWILKVYDIPYKSGMETDVQDVFIASMTQDPADENKLHITNENGDEYIVDISTKTVTAVERELWI